MKQKLCLHGLEVKNQAQLLNLAKRLLPGSTVKVKIKEKYFNDNDMYKYRLTRFTPENTDGVRLYCAWGTLLVSDKLLSIADIILEFENTFGFGQPEKNLIIKDNSSSTEEKITIEYSENNELIGETLKLTLEKCK